MSALATTLEETPVFFPAAKNHLFGVFTRPTTEPNGVAVILLAGGLFNLSIGRNRFTVRLARELAAAGYHCLRLDAHGVGESTGMVEVYQLDVPLPEDFNAAVGWIREQGIDRFVLVGSCFGGRMCLAGAAGIPQLEGVALFSVPVIDYERGSRDFRKGAQLSTGGFIKRATRGSILRGLRTKEGRARYWRFLRGKSRSALKRQEEVYDWEPSTLFLGQVAGLIERSVPLLLSYGTEDLLLDFKRSMEGELGDLVRKGGDAVQVELRDSHMHGFPSLAIQDDVLRTLRAWLGGIHSVPRQRRSRRDSRAVAGADQT